jgi:hypothetical protein
VLGFPMLLPIPPLVNANSLQIIQERSCWFESLGSWNLNPKPCTFLLYMVGLSFWPSLRQYVRHALIPRSQIILAHAILGKTRNSSHCFEMSLNRASNSTSSLRE